MYFSSRLVLTISAFLQQSFGGVGDGRGVTSSRPANRKRPAGRPGVGLGPERGVLDGSLGCADTIDGAALGVAAVPPSERRTDALQQQHLEPDEQQLDLGAGVKGGGARTPSPGRIVRWLD